jgi:hypothetical protein
MDLICCVGDTSSEFKDVFYIILCVLINGLILVGDELIKVVAMTIVMDPFGEHKAGSW